MYHRSLYIHSLFSDGAEGEEASQQVVRSPYDESVLGTAAQAGPREIELSVSSAETAFKSWQWSTHRDRQVLLRNIARLIQENVEELRVLMAREIGKPIAIAQLELDRAITTFELCADLLSSYGGEWIPADVDRRGKDYHLVAERFPIGPILGIVPYNWPINLTAHKIGPAISTGNTIIIKCSPFAPLTTLTLGQLIHQAGCPAGVINIVNCSNELAERMARDERVPIVSFTGSAKVGWHLKGLLPEKRVILELGNNSASIVHEDANLELAIQKNVFGAFAYAGQSCISVQHIYAHEAIYDAFKERLIEATKACLYGDPEKTEVVCGPLVSSEAADRVSQWVQEAEEKGASILVRGKRTKNLIGPTLVENSPADALLSQEEVFGPVVTLEAYNDLDQVIEKINASKYGIHTGLFTNDLRIVSRVFKKLHTGGLIVNDAPTMRLDIMPYGGVKKSGFGREGIRYAFDEYTQIKALLTHLQ
jgi:acyl-CoA reductase-like NAD-dependent aldehyde dehydrogenase